MLDLSLLRETVLGLRQPSRIVQVGRSVYRVTLTDGLTVALKQVPDGPPPDPLKTEAVTLEHLHGLRCSVPAVHLVEPVLRVLVTAWGGDRTMDDLCQETGREAAERAGEAVAEGLCKIEAALTGNAGPLTPLVLTPDAREEMAAILRNIWPAIEEGTSARTEAHRRLEQIGEKIYRNIRSVASLDHNARNVVMGDDGTVRFIDFSSVGWDWPERRFVQYVTGLGAYRAGGRVISPLTPQLATRYAEVRRRFCPDIDEKAVVRALDAHDLLFHLTILARLVRLRRRPESEGSRLLRRAWDNPEERWQAALRHLARPLSDDPDVNALREMFRREATRWVAPTSP